ADPLADGHLGQHLVDQVSGEVRHAAAEARGAEAAALAREADDHRVAAAHACQLDQAMLEHAAAQILLEVADHEARQAALLLGALEERRPVLLHQPVEQRRLWLTARVPIRPRRARLRRRAHGPCSPTRVGGLSTPHADSTLVCSRTLTRAKRRRWRTIGGEPAARASRAGAVGTEMVCASP